MRVDIVKEVNLPKLQMELLAEDLVEATAYFGEHYFIAKDNLDMDLVQQIIDAHDPTPIPQPLSEIEKLRLEQAQANSELVQLIMTMGGA